MVNKHVQADALRENQEALPAVPVPTDIKLPIQQSGIRLSRALPYELHTSARCKADGKVQLIFLIRVSKQRFSTYMISSI